METSSPSSACPRCRGRGKVLIVRGPVALTMLVLANVVQYCRIAEERVCASDGICFRLIAVVGVIIWLLAGGLWTECPRCSAGLTQLAITRDLARCRERRLPSCFRMLWPAYVLAAPQLRRFGITSEEKACIAYLTLLRLLRSWTFMLFLLLSSVLAANVLLAGATAAANSAFLGHFVVSLAFLCVATAFLVGRIRACATRVFSDWLTITRQSYCASCGYDLRGSDGERCPECGYSTRANAR
jgi:hypothetical protein